MPLGLKASRDQADNRHYTTCEEMADFENAEVIRGLASVEIGRMTNLHLKKSLATLINHTQLEQPDNNLML